MGRVLLPCVMLFGFCSKPEPLVCTRPGRPACIDVKTDLADGVWSAEEQWLLYGKCSGPRTGSTADGTWVSASSYGACAETDYFDRRGVLVATYGCCDNTCVATGAETPNKVGASRDLCLEAKANLTAAGTAVRGFDGTTLQFADGGTVAAERLYRNHVRWLLAAGSYELVDLDGGAYAFEIGDGVHEPVNFDGGAELRYGCRLGECVIWRRKPPTTLLSFMPGFERADGGSAVAEARDGGPRLPGVPR